MAHYDLSKAADEKISEIYEYSLLNFGEARADKYFLGMHEIFEVLAEKPFLGRLCTGIDDNLRRFLYRSHVIFYRQVSDGIFIVDVFGERQIPPFSSGN